MRLSFTSLRVRVGRRVFAKSVPDREFPEVVEEIRKICRFDPLRAEWVLDPRLALARGWETLRRFGVPDELVGEVLKLTKEDVEEELERYLRDGVLAVFCPGRENPPAPFKRDGDFLVLPSSDLLALVEQVGREEAVRRVREVASRGYWREAHLHSLLAELGAAGKLTLEDHEEGLLLVATGLSEDQLRELEDTFYIQYNVQTRSGLESRLVRIARRVRRGSYVVPPFMFHHLKRFAEEHGLRFEDRVTWPSDPIEIRRKDYDLFPFQAEAVSSWEAAGRFGTVVIPTGGGKTYVGLEAIARTGLKTLVCVVTMELATQWREFLEAKLGVTVGEFSGREKTLGREVVVGIYNSVAKHMEKLKDLFGLVIFDEVHHVPASTFRKIAFVSKAKFRLGLSATPERSDGNEHLIFLTAGDVVYKIGYRELVSAGILAPLEHKVLRVQLADDERRAMMAQLAKVRDENARLAVMKKYALRARAKIPVVAGIVEAEKGRKILIFCEYIDQAEAIQEELERRGIKSALLVGKTREREEIFDAFRRCDLDVIVTTRVLDEGIDVPDADVAIIASGSGSPRQMAQRVGRILRGKPGKVAKVYEVVARGTIEEALAKRRRKALAEYVPSLAAQERRRRRRPGRLPLS